MPTLPRWTLDTIYTGPESDAFQDNKNLLYKTCEAVIIQAEELPSVEAIDLPYWFKDTISHVNMMSDLYENLESYAYTRFSVNTRDTQAQETLHEIESISMQVKAAGVAFKNAVGSRAGELTALCGSDGEFSHYAYTISRLAEESARQMAPELEALASELQRCGGDAWGRLQEAVSSTASALWDDETGERKSVIELRALAFHPDREIRQKAFRKELETWKAHEIPLGYAINGVKGATVALDTQRGYPSNVAHSAQLSRITMKTLGSLISVLEEAQPLLRRYFRKKAELLGLEKLSFYDIFAPISSDEKSWEFSEARDFIIRQFGEFYPPMGTFASEAFEKQWIDAQPDDGKVGGAYCIGFPLVGESRVLCNFDGSFSSVSTVAHELGHAFHSHVLNGKPALLRDYPMTLAETASIFSETVIFQGALKQAGDEERLSMIESYLAEAAQPVVDILSRYYFETDLFARRAGKEVAPEELCSMMTSAQKRTYGDALDEEELHPYMWAVKGHYYSTDLAFYNYPYAFGQLFGMALYAQYQQKGAPFCEQYVQMLQLTGQESSETVTASAGFDIETEEFWRSGITILEGYVEEFCRLADTELK